MGVHGTPSLPLQLVQRLASHEKNRKIRQGSQITTDISEVDTEPDERKLRARFRLTHQSHVGRLAE
jgi:hypothetical protein